MATNTIQQGGIRSYTRHKKPNILLRLLRLSWGVIALSLKRMWHQPGLTLLALLGITLSVGLITNAAFFSQAVDMIVMQEELKTLSDVTGRPAFSTRIYTLPSSRSPMSLTQAEDLGQNVSQTLATEVGLPVSQLILQVQSEGLMVQPDPASDRYNRENSTSNLLLTTNMFHIGEIAEHIEVIGGEPFTDEGRSGEVIDVWMHSFQAEKIGAQIGEVFGVGQTLAVEPILIRLAGFWEPLDPEDNYWFNDPNLSLREKMLVRRSDFIERFERISASRTGSVGWYITLNESRLNPDYARDYVEGFERGMNVINKYVPNARLDTSPLDPLSDFVGRQNTLTIMLLGFNLPAFGFLIYFLILTSAIIARWQRRETSTLMSRGMSLSGVLGLTLVEQVLLFVIGFPLGIAFGLFLARMMGYTESFLAFTQRDALPVSLAGANFSLAVIALGISLVARLWPTLQAARSSVVDYTREQARQNKGPFWYRFYLDFLLILPTYYAYQQLEQRGTLARLSRDGSAEGVYSDPLLIILPALFVLTSALLTMRLYPLLMRFLDLIANLLPMISPHLALRQMGRQGQNYINPLLLVIISLALGIYTFSMAASLDQWLIDRVYYRAGADLAITPYSSVFEGMSPSDILDGEWIPLPDQFEGLAGIENAARVGLYSFEADIGRRRPRGTSLNFMALERNDFTQTAWFREDFAPESLAALMNRLATTPSAIIVPHRILEMFSLNVGDEVSLRVKLAGGSIQNLFLIVGTYDYFPTVYDDDITIIGNMDYLTSFYGLLPMHRVWLDLEDGADPDLILRDIRSLGIDTSLVNDATGIIAEEQAQMERVGIFGTLTIGFIAAAVMAGLGLLINTYASLRDRLYRFAVLHAIGLKRRQIIAQVILEYGTLTAYGAVAGAVIGSTTAQLFVPFFRVTAEEGIPLPPLIPLIAQDQITLMAVVFALILILSQLVVITLSIYRRLFGRMSVSP